MKHVIHGTLMFCAVFSMWQVCPGQRHSILNVNDRIADSMSLACPMWISLSGERQLCIKGSGRWRLDRARGVPTFWYSEARVDRGAGNESNPALATGGPLLRSEV